jgi:hypothetical protein
MDIACAGPFRVGSLVFRLASDRWALSAVVKGTFTLEPGQSGLAAQQEPVHERDVHWEDDPSQSVRAPADLVPFKRGADILLVGSAFAPGGKPVRSLVARMVVGALDKSIVVYSQRTWTPGGDLREGPHWTRMPIRYENAAGGADTWNPVGVSPDAAPGPYGERPAPSVLPPGFVLASRRNLLGPIGFGPIAASWLLRREKLRGLPVDWSVARIAETTIDDDFDALYFQTAPPDQQVESLRDDESLLLENLHPDHPRLETRLSGLHPRAFIDVGAGEPRDVPLSPDTLWIDSDRAIVTVTWRGQVPLTRPDAPGRVLVVPEGAGQRLTWETARALIGAQLQGSATRPKAPADPSGPRATVQLTAPAGILGGMPAWLASAEPALAPQAPPVRPPPTFSPLPARPPSTPVPPVAPAFAIPPPFPVPPENVDSPRVLHGAPSAVAVVGALEASNAAAARAEPTATLPAARPPTDAGGAGAAVPLELVWCDPSCVERVRRVPAWASLLQKPPKKPPPPRGAPPPPADSRETVEQAGRADLAVILATATAEAGDALEALVERALSDEATLLMPPLLLVAGELELLLDDVALLEATAQAARPLASADKKLKELLDLAGELVKSQPRSAPDVVEGLVLRIREAWARANRLLPRGTLEIQPERRLLQRRSYQKRELLGGCFLRALFTPTGAQTPVPTYIPAAVAGRLPLYKHFKARAIAEALPRQDASESHPAALRVEALARVIAARPTEPAAGKR